MAVSRSKQFLSKFSLRLRLQACTSRDAACAYHGLRKLQRPWRTAIRRGNGGSLHLECSVPRLGSKTSFRGGDGQDEECCVGAVSVWTFDRKYAPASPPATPVAHLSLFQPRRVICLHVIANSPCLRPNYPKVYGIDGKLSDYHGVNTGFVVCQFCALASHSRPPYLAIALEILKLIPGHDLSGNLFYEFRNDINPDSLVTGAKSSTLQMHITLT